MRLKQIAPSKLLLIANILIAAGLVFSIVMVAKDRGKPKKPQQARVQKSEARSQKRKPQRQETRQLQYYEPLLKKNIFGYPPSELRPLSAGTQGDTEAAPAKIRSLDFELIGTVAWADGRGFAIFSGTDAEHEVVKTGEMISEGIKLKSVMPDRVVIYTDTEEMEMPISELASTEEADRSSRGSSMPGRSGSIEEDGVSGFAKKTSEGTYVINQNAIEASLNNPKRMLTDARLLPNISKGKQEGFVIREIKRGGLYETLGLKNGDVLLKVNDFDISGAESGLQAFTALKGMDKIQLDIMRDGKKMSLTYLIR